MIRVHTGRGWRYNPHLLAELRAVRGRGGRHPPIVDVLGVEIDGIDLFTGLSEDRIVEVTADLATALSRLASGHRRAQVPCSGGAVDLLLERQDDERAALDGSPEPALRRCSFATSRSILMRCAAPRSGSARGLLDDLRKIHPRLIESAPADRLARSLAGPLGKPPRPCPPAPAIPKAEGQLVAQSRPAWGAGFRLEILDEESIFESFAGGRADLHSLLAPGVLLLEPGGALYAWSARGVPFLLLKDLVQSALEVVRAIEEGDPEHELPLGRGLPAAEAGTTPDGHLRARGATRQTGGGSGLPAVRTGPALGHALPGRPRLRHPRDAAKLPASPESATGDPALGRPRGPGQMSRAHRRAPRACGGASGRGRRSQQRARAQARSRAPAAPELSRALESQAGLPGPSASAHGRPPHGAWRRRGRRIVARKRKDPLGLQRGRSAGATRRRG